jgi:protein-S-isoprenylcysteine O-methyltransferase Ste14
MSLTPLASIELAVQLLGGLVIILLSINVTMSAFRANRKSIGRVSGKGVTLLRSPWFMGIGSIISIAIMVLLWIPLPIPEAEIFRWAMLVIGVLLFFGGMAVVWWGRVTLGSAHNVSSSMGAEVFTGQGLITGGPFAYVRNPMYLGFFVSLVGALLLYHTWTIVLLLVSVFSFTRRALREEEVLAAEFGTEYEEYRRAGVNSQMMH